MFSLSAEEAKGYTGSETGLAKTAFSLSAEEEEEEEEERYTGSGRGLARTALAHLRLQHSQLPWSYN